MKETLIHLLDLWIDLLITIFFAGLVYEVSSDVMTWYADRRIAALSEREREVIGRMKEDVEKRRRGSSLS